MPDQQAASQFAKELLARLNKSPIHYDSTGKTREPPHCPSCHCDTAFPSRLDQIRQHDVEDMKIQWISDSMRRANSDRHWLLGQVDRMQAELDSFNKDMQEGTWVKKDDYSDLMRRSAMLSEVQNALSQPEDTF